MMISAYGSSGFFGYIVRSKSIGHHKYTGRRSNFCSKSTPIHEPAHKSHLNYSYSISHFIILPQAVAKLLMYCLSQKVSNASKIIDPVINGFIPNDVPSNLHIFKNSNFTFRTIEKCIGSSNNYYADSLDIFRGSVVDKAKAEICIL